jgi:hypothetical protein
MVITVIPSSHTNILLQITKSQLCFLRNYQSKSLPYHTIQTNVVTNVSYSSSRRIHVDNRSIIVNVFSRISFVFRTKSKASCGHDEKLHICFSDALGNEFLNFIILSSFAASKVRIRLRYGI